MALVLDGDNGIVGVLATNTDGDVIFDTDTLFVDAVENKVGIGTLSPSQILHLSSGTSRVRIQSTAADEASINFDTPSGQTYMGGTGANGEIISSSSAGDFVLSHRTGGKIQLSADGAFADAHLTIIETGNVGIGTTSPDAPLHVDGAGYGSPYGGLRVIGAGTGAGSTNVDQIADFGIGNSGSVSGVWLGGRSDQTTGVIGAKTASGNLAFEVYSGGWQERLRISNNGNVGIGTDSPLDKLTVRSTDSNLHSTTLTKGTNTKGVWVINSKNDDDMMGIHIGTGDGTHFSSIVGARTANTSHWGTHLGFYTHGNNTSALNTATERMRIDGDGRITTPYQPAFRFGRSGSYTPGAGTDVLFNTTAIGGGCNIGNHYNTSNGIFTAPVTGMYSFTTIVLYEGVPGGTDMNDSFRICINGSNKQYSWRRAEYENGFTGNGGYYSDFASTQFYLSANDTVSIRVKYTQTIHGNQEYTTFSGYLIG